MPGFKKVADQVGETSDLMRAASIKGGVGTDELDDGFLQVMGKKHLYVPHLVENAAAVKEAEAAGFKGGLREVLQKYADTKLLAKKPVEGFRLVERCANTWKALIK
jgi:hypothetical protein